MKVTQLAFVLSLAACGNSAGGRSGDDDPATDAGGSGAADGAIHADGGTDGAGSSDGSVTPPVDVTDSLECFYNTSAQCAAPVITAAYLTTNCEGTTGVFVVGTGFRSPNKFNQNNGWLAYGPTTTSPKLNGGFWNVLTPTFMCITTSADATYWANFDLAIVNHDGKTSNTVTVANLLGSRPSLASTGSAEPFDPDACLGGGMSQAQALARFSTGASTATIANTTIYTRTRACNTATGCTAWNTRSSLLVDQAVGFALTNNGQTVNFTLAGQSCGALNANDYTTTYNTCALAGQTGSFRAHVAPDCTSITRTTRSVVQSNGNYTQTVDAAQLRY